MEPLGHKISETPTSTYWFDDEGILCAVSKNTPLPSLEDRKRTMEEFKKKLDGKKICMIMDITNSAPTDKESRNYNANELPKIFNAIAFICRSPLGKMLAHLYMGFSPGKVPTKIFSKEKDAREWIREYL